MTYSEEMKAQNYPELYCSFHYGYCMWAFIVRDSRIKTD